VVPGLAGAKVLLDRDGSIARLMRDLHDFDWEPLRAAANAQVSYLMYGFVEPLQKLANEIARGNLCGVA
jgi:hypothetical protein